MPSSFLYFERDQYIGSRSVDPDATDADGNKFYPYVPHTAYFCPRCGELWGRQLMADESIYSSRGWPSWTIEKRPCVEHGDGQFLYAQPLDGADDALLSRELAALLENHHE